MWSPTSSYLAHAEACLVQAAASHDEPTRTLHAQECSLWLMLARQRKAIEAVVQIYACEAEALA